MKLANSQREHLATVLGNSANIFLASLVVGQFVERAILWGLVFGGGLVYLALVIGSTVLRGKG
jgi:hypothetical protein